MAALATVSLGSLRSWLRSWVRSARPGEGSSAVAGEVGLDAHARVATSAPTTREAEVRRMQISKTRAGFSNGSSERRPGPVIRKYPYLLVRLREANGDWCNFAWTTNQFLGR